MALENVEIQGIPAQGTATSYYFEQYRDVRVFNTLPSGLTYACSWRFVDNYNYVYPSGDTWLLGNSSWGIKLNVNGDNVYIYFYLNGSSYESYNVFNSKAYKWYEVSILTGIDTTTQKGSVIVLEKRPRSAYNDSEQYYQLYYINSFTNSTNGYNWINGHIVVLYTWQSVPAIVGKNGTLNLWQLEQTSDGNPVSGASSSVFFAMPEECSVKRLYPNIIYGQEQVIAYSGINELSVRWDSASEAFFRFTIYDSEGEYDWSYGYSFSGIDDDIYIMLLTDITEEHRYLRPSFVNKDGSSYDYNQETISDENAARLYDWFVINYEGESIFGPPNEPAGGGGSLPVPDEAVGQPTLNNTRNAINTGFTRMYWITDATALNDFASWMSDSDRIWDKLWETDPLQGIIEIALCPIYFFEDDDLFSTTIKIFGQDTEISAYRLSKQFFRLNCGEYKVPTQMGDTYLDFAPYTTIKVFLPYIGILELNTNDVMGRWIKLEYTFDILWGICIAHIYVKNDDEDWTLHYERHGQYLINIPITKADRGQEAAAIKGAITRIASFAGSAIGLGVSGGDITESSTLGAAGMGGGILGGTVSTAMNVMTSHPQITYSDGSVGGLSGYMGPDEPYIMIETPITARPENDELYTGMPCYITGNVGDYKNYNKFLEVHLEGIPCTANEQKLIYKHLAAGIIINTGSATPDDEPVHEGNSVMVFLKMTSEENCLGKTFGNKLVLEGKLIYDTSIENPKFLVNGDVMGYNYVYVPFLSRFYFVDDIILKRNGDGKEIEEVSLSVDVLQSFKTEIRSCKGIPERTGDKDKINYYVNDGAIIAQQNTRVITQKFRNNAAAFSFNKAAAGYLLTVADANLST